MTKLEITDALYDWTNEDLDNRCSICVLLDGDMITWLNRGLRNKLVKALINAFYESEDIREQCRQALRYIDEREDRQRLNNKSNDKAGTK